jgi:hypothetical protein
MNRIAALALVASSAWHSAEVIPDQDPVPNMGGDPAVPRSRAFQSARGSSGDSRGGQGRGGHKR